MKVQKYWSIIVIILILIILAQIIIGSQYKGYQYIPIIWLIINVFPLSIILYKKRDTLNLNTSNSSIIIFYGILLFLLITIFERLIVNKTGLSSIQVLLHSLPIILLFQGFIFILIIKTKNQITSENSSDLQTENDKETLDNSIPNNIHQMKRKILFIAANPTKQAEIQTGLEYRVISDEINSGEHREMFEFLKPQFAVTKRGLMTSVNEKPNIIHFSGHGSEEGIMITEENNDGRLVPLKALMLLFTPLKDITEAILLNSCYSANQATEISKLGMYVIGHNLPIEDNAAISFAQGLYIGLGSGKSLKDAYNDAKISLIIENASYENVVEVWKDGKKLVW